MTRIAVTALILMELSGPGCRMAAGPSRPELPGGFSMPAAIHGHRAHLVGGSVVVLGGFDSGSSEPDRGAAHTWKLDTAIGKWTRGADMPTPRAFFGSVVMAGRIVAIGDGLDVYDPSADRWEVLVPAETFPRSHFAAAAVGSRVYVIGGFPTRGGGCIGYDTSNRALLDPPEPPGFREGDHFHIMAELSGEVHIVGGLENATFSPTVQHWVLRDGAWVAAAPAPEPMWLKFSVAQTVGDRLYIFEGPHGWCYDASDDRWTPAPGLGAALVMPASIAIDQQILVLGGMRVDGGSRTDVPRFSIEQNAWLAPAP